MSDIIKEDEGLNIAQDTSADTLNKGKEAASDALYSTDRKLVIPLPDMKAVDDGDNTVDDIQSSQEIQTSTNLPDAVYNAPTYSREEMLDKFAKGESYSPSELKNMSEKQYLQYVNTANDYYSKNPTSEMKQKRVENDVKIWDSADTLAKMADYVVGQTDGDDDFAYENREAKKYKDSLTKYGRNFKDIAPESRVRIAEDIKRMYDDARNRRGHLEVFKDSLVRGHSNLGAMLFQGWEALTSNDFENDNERKLLEASKRVNDLENISAPRQVSSYKEVNSLGSALDYVMESFGENVERIAIGAGSAAAGGVLGGIFGASAIGGLLGGSAGTMILNTGEAVSDQLDEAAEDKDMRLSRGYALLQGTGYSLVDGAFGIQAGMGKLWTKALQSIGKDVAKGTGVKVFDELAKNVTVKGALKEWAKDVAFEAAQEPFQSQVIGRGRRYLQTGSALTKGERDASERSAELRRRMENGDTLTSEEFEQMRSGENAVLTATIDEALGGASAAALLGFLGSATAHSNAVRVKKVYDDMMNVLNNEVNYNSFDTRTKMMIKQRIANDALLATTNVLGDEDIAKIKELSKDIDKEFARMAESGNDAENVYGKSAQEYVNLHRSQFAALPMDEGVTRGVSSGIESRVSPSSFSSDNGGVDELTGITMNAVADDSGKIKGYTVENAKGLKNPVTNNAFDNYEDALKYATDLDIYNQVRDQQLKPKREVIKNVYDKMYGSRAPELIFVDRPTVAAGGMYGLPSGTKGAYDASKNTVLIDADSIDSLGELYTVLSHERSHEDIAESILGESVAFGGETSEQRRKLAEGRQKRFGKDDKGKERVKDSEKYLNLNRQVDRQEIIDIYQNSVDTNGNFDLGKFRKELGKVFSLKNISDTDLKSFADNIGNGKTSATDIRSGLNALFLNDEKSRNAIVPQNEVSDVIRKSNDWGRDIARTGEEMVVERMSVSNLVDALQSTQRGFLAEGLRRLVMRISNKMANDMGVDPRHITNRDVAQELTFLLDKEYIGKKPDYKRQETVVADDLAKNPSEVESENAAGNDVAKEPDTVDVTQVDETTSTQTPAQAKGYVGNDPMVDGQGENIDSGVVIKRADGRMFTKVDDGWSTDFEGKKEIVTDSVATEGGWRYVTENVKHSETSKEDVKTEVPTASIVKQSETAVPAVDNGKVTEIQSETPKATEVAYASVENGGASEIDDLISFAEKDGEPKSETKYDKARRIPGLPRKKGKRAYSNNADNLLTQYGILLLHPDHTASTLKDAIATVKDDWGKKVILGKKVSEVQESRFNKLIENAEAKVPELEAQQSDERRQRNTERAHNRVAVMSSDEERKMLSWYRDVTSDNAMYLKAFIQGKQWKGIVDEPRVTYKEDKISGKKIPVWGYRDSGNDVKYADLEEKFPAREFFEITTWGRNFKGHKEGDIKEIRFRDDADLGTYQMLFGKTKNESTATNPLNSLKDVKWTFDANYGDDKLADSGLELDFRGNGSNVNPAEIFDDLVDQYQTMVSLWKADSGDAVSAEEEAYKAKQAIKDAERSSIEEAEYFDLRALEEDDKESFLREVEGDAVELMDDYYDAIEGLPDLMSKGQASVIQTITGKKVPSIYRSYSNDKLIGMVFDRDPEAFGELYRRYMVDIKDIGGVPGIFRAKYHFVPEDRIPELCGEVWDRIIRDSINQYEKDRKEYHERAANTIIFKKVEYVAKDFLKNFNELGNANRKGGEALILDKAIEDDNGDKIDRLSAIPSSKPDEIRGNRSRDYSEAYNQVIDILEYLSDDRARLLKALLAADRGEVFESETVYDSTKEKRDDYGELVPIKKLRERERGYDLHTVAMAAKSVGMKIEIFKFEIQSLFDDIKSLHNANSSKERKNIRAKLIVDLDNSDVPYSNDDLAGIMEYMHKERMAFCCGKANEGWTNRHIASAWNYKTGKNEMTSSIVRAQLARAHILYGWTDDRKTEGIYGQQSLGIDVENGASPTDIKDFITSKLKKGLSEDKVADMVRGKFGLGKIEAANEVSKVKSGMKRKVAQNTHQGDLFASAEKAEEERVKVIPFKEKRAAIRKAIEEGKTDLEVVKMAHETYGMTGVTARNVISKIRETIANANAREAEKIAKADAKANVDVMANVKVGKAEKEDKVPANPTYDDMINDVREMVREGLDDAEIMKSLIDDYGQSKEMAKLALARVRTGEERGVIEGDFSNGGSIDFHYFKEEFSEADKLVEKYGEEYIAEQNEIWKDRQAREDAMRKVNTLMSYLNANTDALAKRIAEKGVSAEKIKKFFDGIKMKTGANSEDVDFARAVNGAQEFGIGKEEASKLLDNGKVETVVKEIKSQGFSELAAREMVAEYFSDIGNKDAEKKVVSNFDPRGEKNKRGLLRKAAAMMARHGAYDDAKKVSYSGAQVGSDELFGDAFNALEKTTEKNGKKVTKPTKGLKIDKSVKQELFGDLFSKSGADTIQTSGDLDTMFKTPYHILSMSDDEKRKNRFLPDYNGRMRYHIYIRHRLHPDYSWTSHVVPIDEITKEKRRKLIANGIPAKSLRDAVNLAKYNYIYRHHPEYFDKNKTILDHAKYATMYSHLQWRPFAVHGYVTENENRFDRWYPAKYDVEDNSHLTVIDKVEKEINDAQQKEFDEYARIHSGEDAKRNNEQSGSTGVDGLGERDGFGRGEHDSYNGVGKKEPSNKGVAGGARVVGDGGGSDVGHSGKLVQPDLFGDGVARNEKKSSKVFGGADRDSRGRSIRDYFADALGHSPDLKNGETVTSEDIRKAFFAFEPDESQKILFERFMPFAEELGVSFKLRDNGKEALGDELAGRVNYYLNTIEESGDDVPTVILHELIHVPTAYAIDAYYNRSAMTKIPVSAKLANAIDKVNKLYNQNKEWIKNEYGATNLKEFMAEMANPKMREALMRRNIWDKIVGFFMDVFNAIRGNNKSIRGNKIYDDVVKAMDDILTNGSQKTFNEFRKAVDTDQYFSDTNDMRYKGDSNSVFVSADDKNVVFANRESQETHELYRGKDNIRPALKDRELDRLAEEANKDDVKRIATIQKALNNDGINEIELHQLIMLERDAINAVDRLSGSIDAINGKMLTAEYEKAVNNLDEISLAVQRAISHAGATLRGAQRALWLDTAIDKLAYLERTVKAKMAKHGVDGDIPAEIKARLEEQSKALAKANAKITELQDKIVEANNKADKAAADLEIEKARGGKPFKMSEEAKAKLEKLSKKVGFEVNGFTVAAGNALLKKKGIGARHAGLGDVESGIDEEYREAFGQILADADGDFGKAQMFLHEFAKDNGVAEDAFDSEFAQYRVEMEKTPSPDGTKSGRSIGIRKRAKEQSGGFIKKNAPAINVGKIPASQQKLDDMKRRLERDRSETIEMLGDFFANDDMKRVVLGDYLRSFMHYTALENPSLMNEEVVTRMMDEANALDPEGNYKIEDMADVLLCEKGFEPRTRKRMASRRINLDRALSLAVKGDLRGAARHAGINYRSDVELLNELDKKLRSKIDSKLDALDSAVAESINGESELANALRKDINELVSALRDIHSDGDTGEKLSRYLGLVESLKNAKREANILESLTRQVSELNRRIAEKDFETKPKRVKPDISSYSMAVQRKMIERDMLRKKFKAEREKFDFKKRTKLQRLGSDIFEILGEVKAVAGSIDFSSVLRQGGQLTWAHPLLFSKNFVKMLKVFLDEDRAAEAMSEILSRENAQYYQNAGIRFNDWGVDAVNADDRFLLNKFRLITGWKPLKKSIEWSERAFCMYLNLMRADVFDHLVASSTYGSAKNMTDSQLKAIGNYINIVSQSAAIDDSTAFGRNLKSAIPLLNNVLWSPRNVISRFQFMWNTAKLVTPRLNPYGDASLRKMFAMELVRYIGGVAVAIAFAKFMSDLLKGDDDPPEDLEFDPRSSEFLKVKFGNTRVDFLSGLAQAIVFSARMSPFGVTKNARGETRPTDRVATLGRFLRGKFSPAMGIAYDVFTGETFEKQDIVYANPIASNKEEKGVAFHVAEQVIPLTFRDLIEQAMLSGIGNTVVTSLGTILGLGANAYDPYTYKNLSGDYRFYKRLYTEANTQDERNKIVEYHPMLKRMGSIDASIKLVNKIKSDIKKMDKVGADTTEMKNLLEREQKKAINLMAGFKDPGQVD